MEEKVIDIQLSIDVIQEDAVACLSFSNMSSNKYFLDQQTICYNNIVRGAYFKIRNEKGKDVDYEGMLVSRDIDPDYFLALNPGEIYKAEIKINELYTLKKGKKYTIQYSAFNPSYLKEQKLTIMQSNVIEFVYK